MRRYLTLFRLKLLDLLAMRGLVLVFAIIPLLLGLLAGTANLGNERSDVRLAVIDQDQSEASRTLVIRLSRNGWPVDVTSQNEAARLLLQGKVDGIVFIEKGFSASLTDLKTSRLRYVEAEGSLVTSIVREAVAAAVLPDYSEQYLLNQIRGRYQEIGQTAPSSLNASFDSAMAAYAAGMTRLNVDYIGQIKPVPTLTLLVSDYSIEVVFLSVFAVLGMTTPCAAGWPRPGTAFFKIIRLRWLP